MSTLCCFSCLICCSLPRYPEEKHTSSFHSCSEPVRNKNKKSENFKAKI